MNNINFNTRKIEWTGNLAPEAAIAGRQNMRVIETVQANDLGLRFEVMQYDSLNGNTNIHLSPNLYFMKSQNLACKQVAIYILNSGVKTEAGAMSYYQGPLEMTTGIQSVGGAIKQAFNSKLTGERFVTPEYKGSGLLVLEPSFKFFKLVTLGQGESIICDKGLFFAASLGVQVEACFAGSVSGTLLGGEGIFQQKLTGPGVALLELPVPMEEIAIINLNNDIIRVDGNFAVLRSGNIQMTVERAGKTLIGSAASGEGLTNVFRGTGQVWLAPTLKAYSGMNQAAAFGGNVGAVNFNTSTQNTN